MNPYKRRGSPLLFFIIYVAFGLYFINYGLSILPIPESITSLDKWIIFVGGILLLLGAFNLFRINRYPY